MKINTSLITIITFTLTASSVLFFLFSHPGNIKIVANFAENHPILAPFLVISWRALAIIIPPLPGGIISWALLPAFGWFWTFIFAATGIIFGTTVGFFLARHFREKLVEKFVPLKELSIWENKISPKTELMGFIIIRLTTGPVMDFMSYVAGLSKISFKYFFIATAISLIPDALLYYLGESVYESFYGKNNEYASLSFILIIVLLALYLIYKSKFFHRKQ